MGSALSPTLSILALVLFGFLALVCLAILWWIVHCALGALCVYRASRFCRRRGFDVQRGRWFTGFDDAERRMEWMVVRLDCLNQEKQRRVVLLAVMPLGGIKLLLNEIYPEPYDCHVRHLSESSDNPLIPVFIPPLVDLLAMKEREKGSPLTEAEVLEIRGNGVCTLLPPARAAEQAEGRGYDDIDPEKVWAEWQTIRNNRDPE